MQCDRATFCKMSLLSQGTPGPHSGFSGKYSQGLPNKGGFYKLDPDRLDATDGRTDPVIPRLMSCPHMGVSGAESDVTGSSVSNRLNENRLLHDMSATLLSCSEGVKEYVVTGVGDRHPAQLRSH